MEKHLNLVTKVLEKIFKAGFTTEKDILAIQLDDLVRVPDINGNEIMIIIELKKAIKNRKIIAFLSGTEDRKEVKGNE